MKKKMYSPAQLLIGTYLGGPLAAMYFLRSNFDALSKFDESKKTLIICILVSIALIAIAPFMPLKFPKMIIPLLYMLPVMWVSKKHLLTKEAIQTSDEYDFQSNWKVLGMSIAWMVAFLIPIIILSLILYSLGIIKIA